MTVPYQCECGSLAEWRLYASNDTVEKCQRCGDERTPTDTFFSKFRRKYRPRILTTPKGGTPNE